MIRLAEDTIDKQDIDNLIGWLQTYPRLTKGDVTIEFEKKWSKFIGTKYSVFVNSGSSANLLMLAAYIFSENFIRNKKIVIPGLSWATDLAPAMQLGLMPILCDINLNNLSVDLDCLDQIFKEHNPGCLMLVSVLGLVPEMDQIKQLCEKYNVVLFGDHCESFGSKFNGKILGNCGEFASTFSLYFGHHLSTIEGGMICTNDEEFYNALIMMRSHGWTRELSEERQKHYQEAWKVNDFDNLYTFYHPGFNLRSTDLQAFIGLGQLDKAHDICQKRNRKFKAFTTWCTKNKLHLETSDFVSLFAYPFLTDKKSEMIQKLKENGIDCRPLICGSMGKQPMFVKTYGEVELPNCNIVDEQGLYVPCHDKLSYDDVEKICSVLNQ